MTVDDETGPGEASRSQYSLANPLDEAEYLRVVKYFGVNTTKIRSFCSDFNRRHQSHGIELNFLTNDQLGSNLCENMLCPTATSLLFSIVYDLGFSYT